MEDWIVTYTCTYSHVDIDTQRKIFETEHLRTTINCEEDQIYDEIYRMMREDLLALGDFNITGIVINEYHKNG